MKKKFNDTFIHGLRYVIYNWKFIPLLWFVNAIGALILSLPLYHLLTENLSKSLISTNLAEGFDYMWFLQFRHIYESSLSQLPFIIYVIAGVYTLVQTFFWGGLVAVFNNPKKNHIVDFFYGGVKYWYRFTKVVVLSLLFFGVAFKINDYGGELISLAFKNSENEMADFILRSLRYVILIFFIGVITIFSDYIKVSLAIKDETKIRIGVLETLNILRKNFFLVFSIFLLISALGALGTIVYNITEAFIPRTPYYYLIVAFVLQQLLIIFRLFIRMFFCSTEVILYKDLSAETAEVEIIDRGKESV